MRKFIALLCTLAFTAAVAGAASAGPGCSYEEAKKVKEEAASS